MIWLPAPVAAFGGGTLILIALAAFVTGSIPGAVGVAGGMLLTGVLALLTGVRASVPIMIPGNRTGRAVLERLSCHRHRRLVDRLAAVGGLTFVTLAFTN